MGEGHDPVSESGDLLGGAVVESTERIEQIEPTADQQAIDLARLCFDPGAVLAVSLSEGVEEGGVVSAKADIIQRRAGIERRGCPLGVFEVDGAGAALVYFDVPLVKIAVGDQERAAGDLLGDVFVDLHSGSLEQRFMLSEIDVAVKEG